MHYSLKALKIFVHGVEKLAFLLRNMDVKARSCRTYSSHGRPDSGLQNTSVKNSPCKRCIFKIKLELN